jgi:2-polyprenyl-6-methoxyphenol hydroxylase-like FAD-dependent oxidoreductase
MSRRVPLQEPSRFTSEDRHRARASRARPTEPGWALAGDVGYDRDLLTAQGISDAFRDAELLADALCRADRMAALE